MLSTYFQRLLYLDFILSYLQGPPSEEAQESARSKWGAGGAELRLAEKSLEEPEESARPKWGAGGAELRLAEKSLEEPDDSARPKWGAGVDLRQMSLEETASQMEGNSFNPSHSGPSP